MTLVGRRSLRRRYIGHTVFTGTGLWIDFAQGRAWTLLTNRVHPSRHFDSGIVALRRAARRHQPKLGAFHGPDLGRRPDDRHRTGRQHRRRLLKTDGETVETFGAYTLAPYPSSVQKLLQQGQAEARIWNFRRGAGTAGSVADAEDALTRAQSARGPGSGGEHRHDHADIGIVGFHGQTMLHRAPQPGRIGGDSATRRRRPDGPALGHQGGL